MGRSRRRNLYHRLKMKIFHLRFHLGGFGVGWASFVIMEPAKVLKEVLFPKMLGY